MTNTLPQTESTPATAEHPAHDDAPAPASAAPAPDVAAEPAPEPAPEPVAEAAPEPVMAEAPTAPPEAEPALLAEPPIAFEAAPDAVAVEPDPEPEAPTQTFEELGLSDPILRAIAEKGYRTPTPIQFAAIPAVLAGRDVLGCAQTGTGKTAGFTLPMLDILSGSRARARMPRSLILEPTRELALQVAENFVDYGKHLKLTHALIIGGESMSDQKDVLMRGVDVLIATPGRLMDMFERGSILLSDCKVLVIDEADRMLDMGFIPDVEKIVSLLPANRQTLFFSATMAPEIRKLADAFLQNPKEITVSKPASVATTITEGLTLVGELDKREALRRLIRSEEVQNALIFCNRKSEVDILYKSLSKHKFSVGALHGDMTQSVRFSTLEKFKAGELRLLCCSDVAARGIDIGGLSHVFNFDVPHHAEDYVHRIGRTGRAGREGRAFTIASPDDRLAVEAVEKLTGHAIPRIVIPGLDPVEWSEGDGRRRGRGGKAPVRGRGAKAPARETARETPRPEPVAEEAAPVARAERPERPVRARRIPRAQAPAADYVAPETMEQPDLPPVPAPAYAAPMDAIPIPPRPERAPRRDDNRRDDSRREEFRRDRDERRPRGRRDDDLGPSVLGFGDDVPAFMLIPARAKRHAATHEDMETTP